MPSDERETVLFGSFSPKKRNAGPGAAPGLNIREQLGQNLTKNYLYQTVKPQGNNRMTTECPVMLAFNHKGKVKPVYCGLWSCSRCAKANARIWAWRVALHVSTASTQAYFWTLTLGPGYRSAGPAFKALPNLWDALRKNVQRSVGKWEYCAFVEGQPRRSHMPHFHIISMSKSPRRLKDIAVQCGFGHQAKEVMIDGPKAASYVAKYASKQSPATPKGFRRVRCSKKWTKLPPIDLPPLIVKSRKETLSEYIMRVSGITGVPQEKLLEYWSDAHESHLDKG